MFTSYLQIFIVFFILSICFNNGHVSGNGIYDQISFDNNDDDLTQSINLDQSFDLENEIPENVELSRRGVWARLFRSESNSPGKMNSHSPDLPTGSGYAFKNGQFHIIPHDKRTIPIELRKALYAHGIVGRRR
jgi:hypothetical protein